MARISLIAAVGKNRELGLKNNLLWHIPEDWEYFQKTTMGHPIVMGRKTFESIGSVLPGRQNIVITRDTSWQHEGVAVAHSLDEALQKAKEIDGEEVFVIGGAQIYREALPKADRLYLTLVDFDAKGEADAYFPAYEAQFTKVLSEKSGEHENLKFKFVVLEK